MDVENSITRDLWLPALGIFIIALSPSVTSVILRALLFAAVAAASPMTSVSHNVAMIK